MFRTCTPRLTLALLGLVLGACRADLPPEYLAQYQKHADLACGCVSKIKPATEEKDGVVYNTKESCDAWRKEIRPASDRALAIATRTSPRLPVRTTMSTSRRS